MLGGLRETPDGTQPGTGDGQAGPGGDDDAEPAYEERDHPHPVEDPLGLGHRLAYHQRQAIARRNRDDSIGLAVELGRSDIGLRLTSRDCDLRIAERWGALLAPGAPCLSSVLAEVGDPHLAGEEGVGRDLHQRRRAEAGLQRIGGAPIQAVVDAAYQLRGDGQVDSQRGQGDCQADAESGKCTHPGP